MPIPGELKAYANRIGYPESETLAKIFSILYDGPYDLEIIQAMPGNVSELSKKTGISEDKIANVCMRLLMQGAIGVDFSKFDVFRPFPAMIELRDSSLLWQDAPQELFELWDKLVLEETSPLIHSLKKRDVAPMVRVIPVERSIKAPNTVLDVDSARNIFKNADIITAIPCVCRLVAKKNNRGQDCPAPETSVCMQTGIFAAGVMARKIGEMITREDALKRIGDAEDAGLVHCTRNNIKKDMFMCNCCSCCCTGLHFIHNLNYPDALAPSRFRVQLQSNECSTCGLCVERCQFNALKLNDALEIDPEKCYGCGNCVITCPEKALTLREIRPESFIRTK